MSYKAMITFAVIFFLRVRSKSTSEYCTSQSFNDFNVNRLESVFTIRDKVYIAVGKDTHRLWIYDIESKTVLEEPVNASVMFNNHFSIIEFVATVLCYPFMRCDELTQNLVIAIGRKSRVDYHAFATFRLQEDGTLIQIPEDVTMFPVGWELNFGRNEFNLNDYHWQGFFPEPELVTDYSNYSNIHAFTFIPSKQLFLLKFFTEDRDSSTGKRTNKRYLWSRLLKVGGRVGFWQDVTIAGELKPKTLNKVFTIGDQIYSVDNDPQYFPKIGHRLFIDIFSDKISLSFKDIVSNECNDVDTDLISITRTLMPESFSTAMTTPLLLLKMLILGRILLRELSRQKRPILILPRQLSQRLNYSYFSLSSSRFCLSSFASS